MSRAQLMGVHWEGYNLRMDGNADGEQTKNRADWHVESACSLQVMPSLNKKDKPLT